MRHTVSKMVHLEFLMTKLNNSNLQISLHSSFKKKIVFKYRVALNIFFKNPNPVTRAFPFTLNQKKINNQCAFIAHFSKIRAHWKYRAWFTEIRTRLDHPLRTENKQNKPWSLIVWKYLIREQSSLSMKNTYIVKKRGKCA